MGRITPRIMIIAVLMLVACNKEATNRPLDSSSGLTSSPSISPSISPSVDVKTYVDETHKELQYGKLLINMDDYHIVSDTRSDNSGIFKYTIDTGKSGPESNITIKVRSIEKQAFSNTDHILSYLSDISPHYEKIRMYNQVTDDSGIIGLYSVTEGRLTKYVVCYREACYFVESDYSLLDIHLFKNDPAVNYELDKQKIQCADSFTTHVNVTTASNENGFEKAVYDILQGKDGANYVGKLSRDENEEYHFILENEKGAKLLQLSTYGEFYDVIQFLDVNMDGYADIRFLEESGTFNNSYALYVWDESAKNFMKVKCDERLSEFDVHDGYLLNYQKADQNSGLIQKLVWDKNTLIKKSEEPYQTD